jgi:hypothetical protein
MSLYSVVYFEQQRGLFCGAHAINAHYRWLPVITEDYRYQ